MTAKLFLKLGTMNSGKSRRLLDTVYNYQHNLNKEVLCLKPSIDTRDNLNECYITARGTDEKQKAEWIYPNTDIHNLLLQKMNNNKKNIDIVFIDECQFLTIDQTKQIDEIVRCIGIPVLCYGLKSTYQCELFPAISSLMALCDDIEEFKNICIKCGRKATRNAKIDSQGHIVTSGDIISIGDVEGRDYHYEPLCSQCYYEMKNKKNN